MIYRKIEPATKDNRPTRDKEQDQRPHNHAPQYKGIYKEYKKDQRPATKEEDQRKDKDQRPRPTANQSAPPFTFAQASKILKKNLNNFIKYPRQSIKKALF